MNRDFAGTILLYIHSASLFNSLSPFGEAGECNCEGKWSCLLKSLIWIPVLPGGEWSEQPVHKFTGREKSLLGWG